MVDHLLEQRRVAVVGRNDIAEAEARALQRAIGTGAARLRRSVYTSQSLWLASEPPTRHRLQIDAVAATRRIEPVFGHLSAAVLWGMPVPISVTQEVHIIASPESTARSKNGVVVHRHDLAAHEIVRWDGVLLTDPLRTAADLARELPFRDAVVLLDFAIHLRRPRSFPSLSKASLEAMVDAGTSPRGAARARRAIEFARAGAGNPGESTGRVVMHELGFPLPRLQVRHPNPRGGSYFTDYEWPDYHVIGEFDGKAKYLKEDHLRGRSPGEAVYEEKIREDHLRAGGDTVARWGWPELRDPSQLARILTQAGLPREGRPGSRS